ncbi:MAG: DUF1150 family protein, partial [Rhodospirillales bacterium]
EAFAMLGGPRLTYVKRVERDGMAGYAVYGAEGTELAILETRELAFAVARQNDFEPVGVN